MQVTLQVLNNGSQMGQDTVITAAGDLGGESMLCAVRWLSPQGQQQGSLAIVTVFEE